MDISLEEGQVRRAYDFYSPVYDFLFKKVFEPGRIAGIRMIGPELRGRVLEVGIGTGLNLPLYPRDMNLVGIDLSEGMLRKAQDKVQELRMGSVTLKVMDASSLDFGDGGVRRHARDLHHQRGARPGGGAPRDAAGHEARRHDRHPEPLPEPEPGDAPDRGRAGAGLRPPRLEDQPRPGPRC